MHNRKEILFLSNGKSMRKKNFLKRKVLQVNVIIAWTFIDKKKSKYFANFAVIGKLLIDFHPHAFLTLSGCLINSF